jgi:hypothetical protein
MKPHPDVREYIEASLTLADRLGLLGQLYEVSKGQDALPVAELDVRPIPNLPVLGLDEYALHGEQVGEVSAHHPCALFTEGCDRTDAADCCGLEGMCGGVCGGCGVDA